MKIPVIYLFRPSLLIGYREEVRVGERIAIFLFSALAFMFWGPLKNMKGISATKVAAAMMNAAQHKTKGVHVVLSGDMQNTKSK